MGPLCPGQTGTASATAPHQGRPIGGPTTHLSGAGTQTDPAGPDPGRMHRGTGGADTVATPLPCLLASVPGALRRMSRRGTPRAGEPTATTAHTPLTGLRRSHPATAHWMLCQARMAGKKGVWRGARRETAPIVEGVWSFSHLAQRYIFGYSSALTCHQHHPDFQLTWEGHCKSLSCRF